jgi:L-glyceraldehyde 3-phosphate reductase
LAQGLLSDKYLAGVPADSRAGKPATSRLQEQITPALVDKLQKLNAIATARGQSVAQLALRWALRDDRVTSLVIGASRVEQIDDNVAALNGPALSGEEIAAIETILTS